jgi:hypothetical protein
MGSGASTPNPANDEDTVAAVLTYSPSDFNLDDTAWIKIYHSYETPDSFSAVCSLLLLPLLIPSIIDNLFHQLG